MDSGSTLLVMLLLGAVHGVNPAMGWLFAVSLGLQEQRRGAVWAALAPLALGHALAIAAALLLAAALGMVLPVGALTWIAAAALLAFGLVHLGRHRHPRYGGMRVGARQLIVWSFLMASAHGAGLMALPFVLGAAAPDTHGAHGAHADHAARSAHAGHATHAGGGSIVTGDDAPAAVAARGAAHVVRLAAVLPVLVHTAGYLAVAGLLAVVVYEKLGLRLLRTAWINLDAIWAAALIVTALLTPLL